MGDRPELRALREVTLLGPAQSNGIPKPRPVAVQKIPTPPEAKGGILIAEPPAPSPGVPGAREPLPRSRRSAGMPPKEIADILRGSGRSLWVVAAWVGVPVVLVGLGRLSVALWLSLGDTGAAFAPLRPCGPGWSLCASVAPLCLIFGRRCRVPHGPAWPCSPPVRSPPLMPCGPFPSLPPPCPFCKPKSQSLKM